MTEKEQKVFCLLFGVNGTPTLNTQINMSIDSQVDVTYEAFINTPIDEFFDALKESFVLGVTSLMDEKRAKMRAILE